MDNKQVTQSYIYKNTDNNLVKRPVEIFGPTSTAVQLGNDGSTTVIKGVSVYVDTNAFWIKDKLITLNKAGAAASGYSCGFEINENNTVTGYLKVNTTRDGWLLKAPSTFEATLSTSGLSANRTYGLPDAAGTILVGSGAAKQIALWSSSSNITALGAMTDGQIIIGSTGHDPVITTITQGSSKQVLVTNAAGSITLSLPQDIDTAAHPTFNDVGITGITSLVNKFGSLDLSISGLDGRVTAIELQIPNFVTNSSLSTTLSDYATNAYVNGTFVTASYVTGALSGYATTSYVTSTLTDYYNKSTSDTRFASSTDFTNHTGNTTSAHGATTSSSPSTILLRDTDGSIPNGAGIQYTEGFSNWGNNVIKTGRTGVDPADAYIFWDTAYPSGIPTLSIVIFDTLTYWDRISTISCRIARGASWEFVTGIYIYRNVGLGFIIAQIDNPSFQGNPCIFNSPFEFVYTYT